MRRADSLEKTLGKTEGRRRRVQQGNEIVGWHHRFNGHEFEQTLGDSEGQGSLVCSSPWGHKESNTTEWLNNSSLYSDYLNSWWHFFFQIILIDYILYIISEWTKKKQNLGVELSVRSKCEMLCSGEDVLSLKVPTAVCGSCAYRLSHILWTSWYALNTMERRAVCTQVKETACAIIAKGTLTLEFPDSWELLSLRMVCFQPQRIFRPQSEPPEEECQTVFQISCLLHRAGLHCP